MRPGTVLSWALCFAHFGECAGSLRSLALTGYGFFGQCKLSRFGFKRKDNETDEKINSNSNAPSHNAFLISFSV